jgi:hypothetical protein
MESKLNLHSKNPAPIRIFSDLTTAGGNKSTKKAKEFEAMLMKRNSKKM